MSGAPSDDARKTQALLERLSNAERDRSHAEVPIRDAATLILIDRTASDRPSVLMGRRSSAHVFMPGAFVFPGGRVDREDADVPFAVPLGARTRARLELSCVPDRPARPEAFAVAAVRETFEETGLIVGRPAPSGGAPPNWAAFAQRSIALDLSLMNFVGRAVTPPGRPRRYDTRFFAADRSAIAGGVPEQITRDAELESIDWMAIERARRLSLPAITLTIIDELTERLATDPDLAADRPIPFYHWRDGGFVRELL